MSIQPVDLVGIAGAVIVLIAFVLNQQNRWQNTDIKYDLANCIGSVLLFAYALLISSLPFFIINLIWAGLSFKDVVSYFLKPSSNRN